MNKNIQAIQYFKQRPSMRLVAVRIDGSALRYVKEQTREICLAAVRQNGLALRYVKEQAPEICLEAVRQNGFALEYVREQTPEICLAAVRQDGRALEYVKEQTQEICLAVVQQNGWSLAQEKQTPQICLAAVQQDGLALRYVKKQTPRICLAAVQRDGLALRYVKKQRPQICLAAVQQNGWALGYVMEPTPEICLAAVQQNSLAAKYATKQTQEALPSVPQNMRVKIDPKRLFEKYNCKIIGQTEDFLLAVPLDRKCAVFFNSFDCGGEGTRWCIGDKGTPVYWNVYAFKKNIFFLLYFIRKHKSLGRKIMIRYEVKRDYYSLYSQDDRLLWDGYHVIDLINTSSGFNADNFNLTKAVNQILKEAGPVIHIEDIQPYKRDSFEELFEIIEEYKAKAPRLTPNDFSELANLADAILEKGNDDDREKFIDAIKLIEAKYHSA
jgi:hypothetical protein